MSSIVYYSKIALDVIVQKRHNLNGKRKYMAAILKRFDLLL